MSVLDSGAEARILFAASSEVLLIAVLSAALLVTLTALITLCVIGRERLPLRPEKIKAPPLPSVSTKNDNGEHVQEEKKISAGGLTPSSETIRASARKNSRLLKASDSSLRNSRLRVSQGELAPVAEALAGHMHELSAKPVVLAIAGGSGSGKTTLATAIFEALGEDHITFISHDNYYKDLTHLPAEERACQNFDHPDSLDTDLMFQHVEALLNGKEVDIPTYDFATHSRKEGPGSTIRAVVRPIILIEGILIFTHMPLVQLFDIKIFVDTDADTRFIRRLLRDVRERGRSVGGVVDQYLSTVRPMHIKFVEPSKRKADIIVPVGLNSVALDLLISRLHVHLNHLDGGSATASPTALDF